MRKTKFTQSARRHKVGRASVFFVLEHTEPSRDVDESGLVTLYWVGADERGRELEIAALEVDDARTGEPIVLVKHVMPTHLRGM